jgi:SAM-dependent methyltransferase
VDDERLHQIAAAANDLAYGVKDVKSYINGAPHLKHASLRKLYGKLLLEVYESAVQIHDPPRVLDLGAGEGSVTLSFLRLGARVTAVDLSRRQIDNLQAKCEPFKDRLEVRCEDVSETLKDPDDKYDIVAVNSFLHHIPDYLGLIDAALDKLHPGGLFFSFQDPLRYDTVGLATKAFKNFSYGTWRLTRGDIVGGLKRRFRRSRGIYLEDSVHDNAEYHAIRNGVDQEAIKALFERRGFDCRIITYFSTQNSLFQPLGAALGFKNLFAVIGQTGQPAKVKASQAQQSAGAHAAR